MKWLFDYFSSNFITAKPKTTVMKTAPTNYALFDNGPLLPPSRIKGIEMSQAALMPVIERIRQLTLTCTSRDGDTDVIGPNSKLLTRLSFPSGAAGSIIADVYSSEQCKWHERLLGVHGLAGCASLAIINRRHQWHFLSHIFTRLDSTDVAHHVAQYALQEGSKFFLLPGGSVTTHATTGQILLALAQVDPTILNTLQFVHPPRWDINIGDGIALYGGKIGFLPEYIQKRFASNFATQSIRSRLGDAVEDYPEKHWPCRQTLPDDDHLGDLLLEP